MVTPSFPQEDASALQPGHLIGEKYQLEMPVAQGGMGSVWVATNVVLERRVAIKVLHSALGHNEVAGARLLREARAAAQIGHVNIVQIFDFGHLPTGEPYIVMELLQGEDLSTLIGRRGRLSAIEAVQLLLPVASALSAAHAKGIVHRDMKPGNVFLATDDLGNETPKVVDFGVAKIHTPDHIPKLTVEGRVVGSPEYLSPEQARGEDDLDVTTDVWAFCITLYECITGDPPFLDANYNRLLRRIIEDEPAPITSYAAGDDQLWTILLRGLHKARHRRWQSMEELGHALMYWLEQDAGVAPPRVRFSSHSRDVDDEAPTLAVVAPRVAPTAMRALLDPSLQAALSGPPVPGPAPSPMRGSVPPPGVHRIASGPPSTEAANLGPSGDRHSPLVPPPVYATQADLPPARPGQGRFILLVAVAAGGILGLAAVSLLLWLAQPGPSSTQVAAHASATPPPAATSVAAQHEVPQPAPSTTTAPEPPAPSATASAEPSASPVQTLVRPPRPPRYRTPPMPTEPNF